MAPGKAAPRHAHEAHPILPPPPTPAFQGSSAPHGASGGAVAIRDRQRASRLQATLAALESSASSGCGGRSLRWGEGMASGNRS